MAADRIAIARIARTLETLAGNLQGAEFEENLAQSSATSATLPISVTIGSLPSQTFLAVVPGRESLRVVAHGTTLADLQAPAGAFLQGEGAGEVWALEVRRVLMVG